MKNNYDKLFLPLNSQEDTLQETRALFVMFPKEELSKIKLDLELSVDIAYSIAGLAATDFARVAR